MQDQDQNQTQPAHDPVFTVRHSQVILPPNQPRTDHRFALLTEAEVQLQRKINSELVRALEEMIAESQGLARLCKSYGNNQGAVELYKRAEKFKVKLKKMAELQHSMKHCVMSAPDMTNAFMQSGVILVDTNA